MTFTRLMGGVAAVALASVCAIEAQAQETTGSIRGRVVSEVGAPVSGASVAILDTRTNTVKTATTDAGGGFSARGLRVGGPYNVTVVAAGHGSQQVNNLTIALGDTLRLPIQLGGQSDDVIVVTGSAIGAQGLQTGASTHFTLDTISGAASISRDLKDVARFDPFVYIDPTNIDAMSIAGTSNRFNSLTIDGVKQNDQFGLNNNGYPTQRSPISIDAVEALTVETAPFNVEYGGFTGGQINAVTKSGTNEFSGSLFYFFTNEDLSADTLNGSPVNPLPDEKTFGGTLGGPIIRDRLWFFASYEKLEQDASFGTGPEGSGAGFEAGITSAEYDAIRDIMINTYGFDSGDFSAGGTPVEDEKFLVSFDLNITDNHRAKLTYQETTGSTTIEANDGDDLGSPSTWYARSEELTAYSLQLFSDWTDNLSTEIKIGRTEQATGQNSLSGTDFANFSILNIGVSGDSLSVGPDFFRHANELSNEAWLFKAKADYSWLDHLFTVGFERDDYDVFNLFVPGSEGSYVFDSVADLQSQTAASLFYQNAVTNNKVDGGASWGYAVNSLYAQDEWTVTDALTVQFGLRYETYESDGDILDNANFNARYGFSNQQDLEGRDIWLPRFGFNWSPDYEADFRGAPFYNFVVRGGIGRFSGGSPAVWISNHYSNNGIIIDSQFEPGPLTGVNGFDIPASTQAALVAGDGTVNVLDPDFDIPSVWRLNLGAEFEMFDGYHVSADFIHGMNENQVFWRDLTCGAPIDAAPDGRPIYNCDPDRSDLLLTNQDKGHSTIWALSLDKAWESGFSFAGSYTHQDVTEGHPGTSSTASSNFSDYASFDRNNPYTATSNYEREHDFKLQLGYRNAFFGDYETRFNMFLNRRSGQPFSYTYDNGAANGTIDIFGINEGFADDEGTLFYVPIADGSGNVTAGSDPSVTYAGGFDIAGFNTFLHDTGLIDYAGEITPRNGFRSRWSTRVDLRIQQEIPFFGPSQLFPNLFSGRERAVFFMDVENVGNMLNDEWGRYEQVRFEYVQPVVRPDIVGGQYVYSNFPQNSEVRTTSAASQWQVQFGIKYQF